MIVPATLNSLKQKMAADDNPVRSGLKRWTDGLSHTHMYIITCLSGPQNDTHAYQRESQTGGRTRHTDRQTSKPVSGPVRPWWVDGRTSSAHKNCTHTFLS